MAFQVIIKSGGNTFHGDGLYAFQTRDLQGNNIDDRLRQLGVSSGNPMDRYYDANGSVGGRIVRDRWWFFGSLRRKEYRQEVLGVKAENGVVAVIQGERARRTPNTSASSDKT